MEKKQMRLLKQLVLLTILFIVCIVSSGMIYLGATIFRMQLPFFQLIDSKDNGNLIVEQLPTEEPLISEDSEDSDVKLFMVMGSDFRPESGFRDRRSGTHPSCLPCFRAEGACSCLGRFSGL